MGVFGGSGRKLRNGFGVVNRINLNLVIKLALCLDPSMIVHRGVRIRGSRGRVRMVRNARSLGSARAAVPFFGDGGLSCTSLMNFVKRRTRATK